MNRLYASFLSISLILAACTSPQPQPDSPPPPPEATSESDPLPTDAPDTSEHKIDPMQTPWDDRSIFKNGLVESEQDILNELNGASVYHIEFTIEDNYFEITGTEEVHYTNTEDVELNEVQFRLFPNAMGGAMEVSNLTVDEQPIEPEYELENSLMIVRLSAPLEIGQSVVISMDYTVTVPQTLELNYGMLAYAEDVLTVAHAYPMVAVYDDEGWNSEIPLGDPTYADTSFYIVRIHAPKELTLVASGTRISLDEDGQTQVLTVANGPARDFFLAASENYEEISNTFGEITIRSYAPKDAENGSQFAVDVAAKSIDVFSKRYIPYPYTELDIVSTPTLALGIEYPGAIVIASRIYDVDGEYRGTPASVYMESTVAHEVGHQWFYGIVGNDQLDDPWLDESLTQFITLQYYTDQYGAGGANGFKSSLLGRWERIEKADIPIGLPEASYEGSEYGAIVYGRGPLFFVALQEEMGSEVFDAFIKEYTETLAWGIATPEYLQSLAETYCACELDTLFDEWVY